MIYDPLSPVVSQVPKTPPATDVQPSIICSKLAGELPSPYSKRYLFKYWSLAVPIIKACPPIVAPLAGEVMPASGVVLSTYTVRLASIVLAPLAEKLLRRILCSPFRPAVSQLPKTPLSTEAALLSMVAT